MNKVDYKKIVKEYGEAFYILDSKKFEKNFIELKESFKAKYKKFNIAYSYKTNYTPKLCKIVNKHNGFAEVVSELELELALKIGVDYKHIIWNGPIKNRKVLQSFLKNGGIANIDNISELKTIKSFISEDFNSKVRLGIRCNYDIDDGIISRFGFDVDSKEFENIVNFIINDKKIDFVSLQCHFAKREIKYWGKKVKGLLEVIEKYNLKPKIIDVGGGLYGKMEKSLIKQFDCQIPSYESYAEIICKLINKKYANCKSKPLLLIEPGSALVGDCMKFISTVKSIKNIRGKYFATVYGSQKNISMQNVNPPIEVIHISNDKKYYENLDFVGFTCIENDVLYHNYFGALAEGDLLIISNCGSYSIVMKPPFILPNFPIIDISGKNIGLIKKQEGFNDIFNTYIF